MRRTSWKRPPENRPVLHRRGLPRVPDLMLRPGLPVSAGYHEGEDSNGVYFVRD